MSGRSESLGECPRCAGRVERYSCGDFDWNQRFLCLDCGTLFVIPDSLIVNVKSMTPTPTLTEILAHFEKYIAAMKQRRPAWTDEQVPESHEL